MIAVARHAGTAAPEPPRVKMTIGLLSPEPWDDAPVWSRGLCWLCGTPDVDVTWIGPAVHIRGHSRKQAPADACVSCLRRIARLVEEYPDKHGP
jgi:hypothetical protein